MKGVLEIPINREGFKSEITGLTWKLINIEDGDAPISDGEITFDPDFIRSNIIISLPSEVKLRDFDTFRLQLLEVSGIGEPYIGEFKSCDIVVKNDVPRTQVFLPS